MEGAGRGDTSMVSSLASRIIAIEAMVLASIRGDQAITNRWDWVITSRMDQVKEVDLVMVVGNQGDLVVISVEMTTMLLTVLSESRLRKHSDICAMESEPEKLIVTTDQWPCVKLNLGGMSFTSLVDSGASKSIMTCKCWKHLVYLI